MKNVRRAAGVYDQIQIFRKTEPTPPIAVNCRLTGDHAVIWNYIQEMVGPEATISEILKDSIRLMGFVLHQQGEGREVKTKVTERGEEREVDVCSYLGLLRPKGRTESQDEESG